MFSKLVEISHLHASVLGTAVLGKRTISKWYNILPTAEKRQLDMYHTQWRDFNLDIVKKARAVSFQQSKIIDLTSRLLGY